VEREATLELGEGLNRIDMKVRNSQGRIGKVSKLKIMIGTGK